ncbi:MAG: GYF domain-containing protein, partial [Myxococcota bacterium]
MKFVCDRCSTRYSISDDKVRGKVLKIRCKTCSNIIVVREPSASAVPAQAQVAASGAHAHVLRGPAPTTSVNIPIPNLDFLSKPAPANTEWWVAIKGTQHGPMKRDGVERLFDEGRISARSYCWHSQMPAWMRLQELPDFAHLANRQPGTLPANAAPPPAAGEVVDLQKARAERAVSVPASPTPAVAPNPGGAINDPFAAAAAASGPLDATTKPGEATRVFIMQAGLANRKAKHRTYAVSAVAGVVALVVAAWGDWTGRWEIPGLHGALSYAAETTGVEVPQQRLLASWDDVKPDMEEKCVLNPGTPDCQRYFAEKAAYLKKQRAKSKAAKVTDDSAIDLDGAFQKGPADADSLQRAGVGSGGATVDPFARS